MKGKQMAKEAVIVGYGRSAVARAFKGSLVGVHPIEYAAQVLNGVVEKVPNLKKEYVEDVIVGCAVQHKQTSMNIAKSIAVRAGMPESVLMWTEARDVSAMQEALSGIIGAYERDFAKHPNLSEFPKISMIWKSIPSQLAKENKKFIYKAVKEGARAREYEDALQWLVDARLVHKIYRSSAPGLPIAAYDDLSAFKIYLVDVGLLRRLAQLAPTAFGEGNRLFTEFKGALSENFVLQTLITQFEVMPRYWSQNNPPYEVDFLIQRENDIFPVEVKSETNTSSKSMKKFKELFPDKVKLRIRFSLDNLKLDDDVLNIPLFMADQADQLIGLALEKMEH